MVNWPCYKNLTIILSNYSKTTVREDNYMCIANTNGPPADSMTLTCSTCNRQFRARIGLVSHQRTHQEPIQEIMMVFLISEKLHCR